MKFLLPFLGQQYSDFNQWGLAFDPLFSSRFLYLAACLFLLALYFSWLSSRRISDRAMRKKLLGLRFVVFLVVFLFLFRPALDLRRSEELPGVVALLVDRSASMSLNAGEGSRSQVVKTSLRQSEKIFEKLAKDFDVVAFTFSSDIQKTSLKSLLDKDEKRLLQNTNLGQSLQSLQKEYLTGKRGLNAVFLFSDGADRGTLGVRFENQGDLLWVEQYPAPIYSFQPGSERFFRDLRIKSVNFDEFGFVKTPLTIEVEVEMEGYESRKVPVSLLKGKEIIASTSVSMAADGEAKVAKIQFSPQKLGAQVYTIKVPEYADEVVKENNQRSIVIRIIRDKIRILHVAGHPSWDEKFLRIALKNDPNIDLIAFYILRTQEDIIYDVASEELSLIPFPIRELFGPELETFDLVIFQDFDFRKFDFPKRHLTNLKDFVEKGGGFMMLGGKMSFSGGGYDQSPLADILPLAMESKRLVSHGFQEKIYAMGLTSVGARHPITRLHPNSWNNRLLWRKMPKLSGINLLGTTLPGAAILGEVSGSTKKQFPLLAVREVGKGRTLALGTDSSWRWNFHRVRDGGTGEQYFTFFKNAIRWLVGDPNEALVDVEAAQNQLQEGDRVQIIVRARDRSYKENAKARLQIRVIQGQEGKTILKKDGKTDSSGRYVTGFRLHKRGHYTVSAQVELKDGTWVEGKTILAVEGLQGEWLKPRINASLLQFLSEKTGGEYRVLPAKLDVKVKPRYDQQVLDRRVVSFWNTPGMLGLLCFVLALEWWFRRRQGLA